MSYSTAFNLLTINRRSSSSYAGQRPGRGFPYTPLTGWAGKDTEGNSSIAGDNKRTWAEQYEAKTKEAYERDQRENYTNDPTEDAFYAKDWDDLSKKEKEAMYDKYAPHLSSTERANRDRNRDADRKAAEREYAKDAVRDYVDEQRQKKEDAGGLFTGADAQKAKRDFKEQQDNRTDEEIKKDDEAKTEALGNNDASPADLNANATIADVNAGDTSTLAAAKAYTDSAIAALNIQC